MPAITTTHRTITIDSLDPDGILTDTERNVLAATLVDAATTFDGVDADWTPTPTVWRDDNNDIIVSDDYSDTAEIWLAVDSDDTEWIDTVLVPQIVDLAIGEVAAR
jgi:hypothetical protein